MNRLLLLFLFLGSLLQASLPSKLTILVEHILQGNPEWKESVTQQFEEFRTYKFVRQLETNSSYYLQASISPNQLKNVCNISLHCQLPDVSTEQIASIIADDASQVPQGYRMSAHDGLYIQDVSVHADYQGRGYARLLIEQLLEWSDMLEIKEVSLLSYNYCHKMYEKFSFRSIHGRVPQGLNAVNLIPMKRFKR